MIFLSLFQSQLSDLILHGHGYVSYVPQDSSRKHPHACLVCLNASNANSHKYNQVSAKRTYVSLTFLHHTVLLKRLACFLKRNVFPCILAVLSTNSSKRSPLSKTLSMFSIMTFLTYQRTLLTYMNH